MNSKVVLISGGTGGIAQALVPRLAEKGYQLMLAARRQDRLEDLAQRVSGQIHIYPTDVCHWDQGQALVNHTVEQLGRIDILLNCAGIGILKPFHQVTPADLDTMLDVNVKGSFYLSQLASQVMREQKSGHILNFPGILGKYPMAMASGYCASKFAVVGFTKCMADELKRFGVKFTLFYFGGIDSPFWDTVTLKVQRDKMLTPATVADAILFALSAPPEAVPGEVVLQPESHQFL